MDGWVRITKLCRRTEASVLVRDGQADYLLVVLHIEPLLADVWIEEDDNRGYVVDNLLVDRSRVLFILVHRSGALGCHPSYRKLEGLSAVSGTDSVGPLQLNLKFIRCLQVVVDGLGFEPVGDDWLEGRM